MEENIMEKLGNLVSVIKKIYEFQQPGEKSFAKIGLFNREERRRPWI